MSAGGAGREITERKVRFFWRRREPARTPTRMSMGAPTAGHRPIANPSPTERARVLGEEAPERARERRGSTACFFFRKKERGREKKKKGEEGSIVDGPI